LRLIDLIFTVLFGSDDWDTRGTRMDAKFSGEAVTQQRAADYLDTD